MVPRKTESTHVDKDIMKKIRQFVGNNGGNIKKVLESGALWVMSDGAKKYIQDIENGKK